VTRHEADAPIVIIRCSECGNHDFAEMLAAHDAAIAKKVRTDTLEDAGAVVDRSAATLSDGLKSALESSADFSDEDRRSVTEAVAMLERIAAAIRLVGKPAPNSAHPSGAAPTNPNKEG
jgi:hypothetical protein